jgi:hypothetical protein
MMPGFLATALLHRAGEGRSSEMSGSLREADATNQHFLLNRSAISRSAAKWRLPKKGNRRGHAGIACPTVSSQPVLTIARVFDHSWGALERLDKVRENAIEFVERPSLARPISSTTTVSMND